jgi:hypothetical protein
MREGLMKPPAGMPEMEGESDTMDIQAGGGDLDPYFGGGEQASPEEQAMYQKAMDAVWGLMYSKEETTNDMLAALENAGGDPAQIGVVAGQLGLPLMEMLDSHMEAKGEVMPESVRLEVGQGIVEEVLEMAETAKVLPDDEDSIGIAISAAIDTMMSRYGRDMAERGMINPQAGQAMLQEMRGVAADRMGISEQALHGGQGMAQEQAPEQAPAPQGGGLMGRGGPPA